MKKRIEKEIINENLSLILDIEVIYEEETSTEECHGFHTIIDTNEISKSLVKAYIELPNEEIIDITDRLTKKEKNQLLFYNV
jgi:hypothetical protein